jgi:RNAse (barnase) inhibitor barstar
MTYPAPRPVLYRLVDEESRNVLLAAEDLHGFFVEPDTSPPERVTFTGVHHVATAGRKSEDTELEVVNHHVERIGSYYIGRTVREGVAPGAVKPDSASAGVHPDQEYSFFGNHLGYPGASQIWQRWAAPDPIEPHEWTRYPVDQQASWLHVVQTAWFTAGRRAARYGTNGVAVIEGIRTSTRPALYCALGEAVNGPGGYFGSNLDALADCLSASRDTAPPLTVEWRDFPGRRFCGSSTCPSLSPPDRRAGPGGRRSAVSQQWYTHCCSTNGRRESSRQPVCGGAKRSARSMVSGSTGHSGEVGQAQQHDRSSCRRCPAQVKTVGRVLRHLRAP